MKKILFILLCLLSLSGLLSPPIALAAGLAMALTLGNPFESFSGVAAKKLLQWSVVGLGFGMNLFAVWAAGTIGFGLTVCSILGTLTMGWIIGKSLGMDKDTALLISSGTAICGGSAIAAVGGVLNADKRAMTVSLATVFVLNAAALFLFPVIGHLLHMGQDAFGLWAAIAIHDTSSVVGAAAKYGDQALEVATSVKLARALWIFPITLGLALTRKKSAGSITFPWFILWFLVAATICTLFPQGQPVYVWIKYAARCGLTLTLFLIGAGLSHEAVRSVGVRPFILGVALWVLIGTTTLLVIEFRNYSF